jgi:hypothetical protein
MSILTEEAILDDGEELTACVPVELSGPRAVLIRSEIAEVSRRLYLFLAAASGTQQVRELAMPMIHAIGKPSGYVLTQEEMAAEELAA